MSLVSGIPVDERQTALRAILCHLYEHPLYQRVKDDEDTINVLVIGLGQYGQAFLDACLQVGQMRDKRLNVVVVSGDAGDKDAYLRRTNFQPGHLDGRPELDRFFNVDGSLEGKNVDSYGDISFVTRTLSRDDGDANADMISNVASTQFKGGHPHYVFIALGADPELNYFTADACTRVIPRSDCVISYAWWGDEPTDDAALFPILVDDDVTRRPLYQEIERMAFNTHLVWVKDFTIDWDETRRQFIDAENNFYNYHSCISCVISARYKLHSVGIDMQGASAEDFARAAADFNAMMADESSRQVRDELICVEHRRWVTEKLCDGYIAITNLEDCRLGKSHTKNIVAKQHVCIRRSRPNQKLARDYNIDRGDWEEGSSRLTSKNLNQLDELDQMSVKLHRMYMKQARTILTPQWLECSRKFIETAVKLTVEDGRRYRQAVQALDEWFACLRDISGNSVTGRGKVRLYAGLRNAFLDAAGGDNEPVGMAVRSFDAACAPVLASREYRDWKQDDTALVDSIPFILTYTDDSCLVIPYALGNTTAFFDNVSAATVANPSRIVYVYSVEKTDDWNNLRDRTRNPLRYIAQYMKRKNFRARPVDFVILLNPAVKSVNEGALALIEEFGAGGRFVPRIICRGADGSVAGLSALLANVSESHQLFAVEDNSSPTARLLRKAGIYDTFDSYTFHSKTMRFTSSCDGVKYLRKAPYITVDDMVSIRDSTVSGSSAPVFFGTYNQLWKLYTGNSVLWKRLCRELKEYAREKGSLQVFDDSRSRRDSFTLQTSHLAVTDPCKYTLSEKSYANARSVVDYLKRSGCVDKKSRVDWQGSGPCTVRIWAGAEYANACDTLFIRHAAMLEQPHSVILYTNSDGVNVQSDILTVEKVVIGSREEELLNRLADIGCITRPQTVSTDGNVCASFSFTSPEAMRLLTSEGRLLEIYVYHKLRASGTFDDVRSSVEIYWNGDSDEVKNEFDCIVTKGFQSVFIECKAWADGTWARVTDGRGYRDENGDTHPENPYRKLSRLMKRVGINAQGLLVADMAGREPSQEQWQKDSRQRGIHTVAAREDPVHNSDIEHIDTVVLNLFRGSRDE